MTVILFAPPLSVNIHLRPGEPELTPMDFMQRVSDAYMEEVLAALRTKRAMIITNIEEPPEETDIAIPG